MEGLEIQFDGEPFSPLTVVRFHTHEEVGQGFVAELWCRSPDPSLDLEPMLGRAAAFVMVSGVKNGVPGQRRVLSGVCNHAELVKAEPIGVSTYHLRIVPRLWLLTQRRGVRIFQHLTAQEIVQRLLAEHRVEATWNVEPGGEKLLYKVQYHETDFAFVRRIVEEAGITFAFVQTPDGMQLVFSDLFHAGEARAAGPIPHVDNPNQTAADALHEFVTHVRIGHAVRPGTRPIRDHDFRRPSHALFGHAPPIAGPESRLEQYAYKPGGFVVEVGPPGAAAEDDKATARHDDAAGERRAARELGALREGKRVVAFDTNVMDLWPGLTFVIDAHAHPDLQGSRRLLCLSFDAEGTPDEEWSYGGVATSAEVPYRLPLTTPRPTARLQSAVIVGPRGQEIHTDEHGRVRVLFPWDREGQADENATPWLRTSQGWAGKGFGMMHLPRIGQEVLIDFLDGDPEQPIVVARLYNAKEPVPYRQPEQKTRSGVKSDSSIGGDGYNEIYFEDLTGSELVSIQAERNLRQLVKRDETHTVGMNREKSVALNETDTTLLDRFEVTGVDRSETVGVQKTTIIGGDRAMLVGVNETERAFGDRLSFVGKDVDARTGGMRREMVRGDFHQIIDGDHMEKVGGHRHLRVCQDQHEKVDGRYALFAREESHFKAGINFVLEAGADFTIRGPAGFIRIGAAGITIQGRVVKINSGGDPGEGRGADPTAPDPPAGADDGETPRAPAPAPMDTTAMPDQRALLESPDGRAAFPNLGSDFEVLGPATGEYNCIAHTLGEHEAWVDPETGSPDPLSEMDRMYSEQCYTRLSTLDYSVTPGRQKIVVYATRNPDGSIAEITHGALQQPDGSWTSKLGSWPLIRHRTPEALSGPVYGEPVAVYER